jgi:hypothetical protein
MAHRRRPGPGPRPVAAAAPSRYPTRTVLVGVVIALPVMALGVLLVGLLTSHGLTGRAAVPIGVTVELAPLVGGTALALLARRPRWRALGLGAALGWLLGALLTGVAVVVLVVLLGSF